MDVAQQGGLAGFDVSSSVDFPSPGPFSSKGRGGDGRRQAQELFGIVFRQRDAITGAGCNQQVLLLISQRGDFQQCQGEPAGLAAIGFERADLGAVGVVVEDKTGAVGSARALACSVIPSRQRMVDRGRCASPERRGSS